MNWNITIIFPHMSCTDVRCICVCGYSHRCVDQTGANSCRFWSAQTCFYMLYMCCVFSQYKYLIHNTSLLIYGFVIYIYIYIYIYIRVVHYCCLSYKWQLIKEVVYTDIVRFFNLLLMKREVGCFYFLLVFPLLFWWLKILDTWSFWNINHFTTGCYSKT